jgi:hypothetical protein
MRNYSPLLYRREIQCNEKKAADKNARLLKTDVPHLFVSDAWCVRLTGKARLRCVSAEVSDSVRV